MATQRNVALKAAIFASGNKQRAISLRARIPEQRLSDIVHGRVIANDDERKRLARVLRTTIDALFTENTSAEEAAS